jgi:hypothetical protein
VGEQPRDKRCAKCGLVKPLAFFPVDRSRPDGHWHTCRACNRLDWQARGKVLAFRKRYSGSPRAGLRGLKLKRYRHGGPRFSLLPPQLQPIAERLLSGYRVKHKDHMTPALDASLVASAASHARLVGNRAWGLSMRAKKGWRTRQRRQAEQDRGLTEIRTRNAGKSRVNYGLDGV